MVGSLDFAPVSGFPPPRVSVGHNTTRAHILRSQVGPTAWKHLVSFAGQFKVGLGAGSQATFLVLSC